VSHAIEAASFAEPAQRARYLDLLGRSDWAAQEWKSALEGGASLGMEELTEAADTAYRAEDYLLALRFAEKAFLRISAEKPFLGKLDSTVRRGLYPVPFPDILLRSACGQDIDPLLVASIMREESRFDPRAKSWAAARGLMQFIPPTARSVAQDLNIPWRGEDSLYDPETAILLGARHLRDLRARFKGDVQKAVAAYNAGEPAVRRWERSGAPDDDVDFLVRISYLETRNYVKRVLNSYAHYRAIYGDGLCARP
jgi:soluble lytic murein transglycosylase